jgi:pseudouridine synthase
MAIRLNKFLSQAGISSRREADQMIVEGRVKVNSEVIQELGYKINEKEDQIEVDGIKVKPDMKLVYLMINKPPGFLVTLKDPLKRPTIKSLLPPMSQRVFPVGRLDFESEGLLLLTNDGELAHRLTHPRFGIEKSYLVKVKGAPEISKIIKLEKGIHLDGKKTGPARITLLKKSPRRSFLRIVIYEGRKREIRKMFEAIGHKVTDLKRVSVGSLKLGALASGKWRFLQQKEVESLKRRVGL